MESIKDIRDIDLIYKINNITHEKCELFYDFFISLIDLIEETYLGYDVLNNEEDIKGHFTWCFNTVISNFEKEKIYFKDSGVHFDYLFLFIFESFYKSQEENKLKVIREYLKLLFDFNIDKTNLQMSVFIQIYKIFNQSLKK